MLIEEVKTLKPLERFEYWIRERHAIFLKKEAGKPKPWTDDVVLQSYYFTNPYRENDKVTRWFKDNIREPLRDDPRVLLATVIFRWFNLPSTGQLLLDYAQTPRIGRFGLLDQWNEAAAIKLLTDAWDDGPVFNGAYIISGGPGGKGSKIPNICRRITKVWRDTQRLLAITHRNRLQSLWAALKEYDGLGGFMSYEIVCDLRYTYLLEHATDKLTWCNPGPGAIRGLNRLLGRKVDERIHPDTWSTQTQELLKRLNQRLPRWKMPPFEMREVEHSLCEFWKMEKALFGLGRMKRKYDGKGS